MNESSSNSSKLYLDIVSHFREMIETDGLKPGDRLPSERSLSERLNAGRSSAREALRALELLGLIETKKGEGTFLRDFQGHRLVQLIRTFVLQDETAELDVLETEDFIQLNCLQIAMEKMTEKELTETAEWVCSDMVGESDFFFRIVRMADNCLLLRLWTILKDYYFSLGFPNVSWSEEDYLQLLDNI
ncbi:GntR family transcriptional regulator [Niallia taxi]|nr:GntR family transcriptional regulator [Niallia taxi]MDE5052311.1 GntR family transcriptional regulator [Niallia taxi]